jgi:hypothetical protein
MIAAFGAADGGSQKMFGSGVLDTAIGLIFVFLLVSMLVTIANELVAAALMSRAKWLRRGIEKLLDPAWAQMVYDHPLIDSTGAKPGWIHSGGPSYIPSRAFVNVLLDVVRQEAVPVQAAREKIQALLDATPADAEPALFMAARDRLAADVDQTGATYVAAALRRVLAQMPGAITVADAKAALQGFVDSMRAHGLRDALAGIPVERVRKTLLVLLEDAEGDFDRFKENVETWFNNAMDRVGGWYKRRSQWVILGLGIAAAVCINVDSLQIVRFLETNQGARDALVAEATSYAKSAEAASAAAPAPAPSADELPAQYQAIQSHLLQLGLPMGWVRPAQATRADVENRGVLPASFDEGRRILSFHLLGWLITALAATLGAPFWFDMLNKVIAIRSVGKSPEERPKPPRQVPLPLQPGETPREAEVADAVRGD